jgi:hypothetical protein
VIPILDTLENMRVCLGATSVGLPKAEAFAKPCSVAGSRGVRARKQQKRHTKAKSRTESATSRGKLGAGSFRSKPARFDGEKQWLSDFVCGRTYWDRPFVETLAHPGDKLDPLSALLGEPSECLSSQEIRTVKSFCQPSQHMSTGLKARAWLSRKPGVRTHYLERVTAEELHLRLMQSEIDLTGSRNQQNAM